MRPEKYFDWGWKWPWEWGWKWRYVIADEPTDAGVWSGPHGSAVVSVLWQAIPRCRIIFLDISSSRNVLSFFQKDDDIEKAEKALQWIIEHMSQYNVDIVNFSFGNRTVEDGRLIIEYLEDEIRTLHDQLDVVLVASAGNKDAKVDYYPAYFDEVISVGGIFDDPDGFLTYAISTYFDTSSSGRRVTDSELRKYYDYPYRQRKFSKGAGSTYNDKLDFVAPMFDIEVLRYHTPGYQGFEDVYCSWSDGTSFSSPIVAGVAGLLIHEYHKNFGIKPSVDEIYAALKQTAETHPTDQNLTPKPIVNGKNFNITQRNDYVGWGCIDAYDAIIYILEHYGGK